VGCQSIGCIRSSNLSDGLNFHLRMRVQMIAIPPIEAAMAMMTVKVVLVVELAPLVEGTLEVELVSEDVTVWNSVFWP
jgi:hypothetical protein